LGRAGCSILETRYRSSRWARLSALATIYARANSALIVKRSSIYPAHARDCACRRIWSGRSWARCWTNRRKCWAWCKLQKKHNLIIPYRDPSGLLRSYEVDFVLRTYDSCYLLETKADDDLTHPTVGIKAQAAVTWCKTISNVPLPTAGKMAALRSAGIVPADFPNQPLTWEYLLLSESLYDANAGASFSTLLPVMQSLRDSVIAQQFHGSLFVT